MISAAISFLVKLLVTAAPPPIFAPPPLWIPAAPAMFQIYESSLALTATLTSAAFSAFWMMESFTILAHTVFCNLLKPKAPPAEALNPLLEAIEIPAVTSIKSISVVAATFIFGVSVPLLVAAVLVTVLLSIIALVSDLLL